MHTFNSAVVLRFRWVSFFPFESSGSSRNSFGRKFFSCVCRGQKPADQTARYSCFRGTGGLRMNIFRNKDLEPENLRNCGDGEGCVTARLIMSEQMRANETSTTTCDLRVRRPKLYLFNRMN